MSFQEIVPLAAQIATVLALVGIALAYWQFRAGARAQRQASAIAAWGEYLRLALAYPRHSHPAPWSEGEGPGSPHFDEYRWFVAATFFACEQVLEAHPKDLSWERIVTAQLKYHRAFLTTNYFDSAIYSGTLQRLVKEEMK